MKIHHTCLAFAMMSACGAAAQAEPRPDWEQALALAPIVDHAGALARFELTLQDLPPGAVEWPDRDTAGDESSPLPSPQDGATLAQENGATSGGWEAVDGDRLDELRGGFDIGNGLIVSLGLERLVSINGELVARTSFALPAAGGIAGDAADAAHEALNNGGLIQNGPGNIAPLVLSADALGATVIQNTLNDQTIRSQTIINATVNSATLMQSLNFNDSVGQAIRDAVRPN